MFLKPKYETGYSLIININFHGCKTLIMFNSYTDIAKSSCQNKDHPIHLFSYDNYNEQLIHCREQPILFSETFKQQEALTEKKSRLFQSIFSCL